MPTPLYYIADAHTNRRTVFNELLGDPFSVALPYWDKWGLLPIVSENQGRCFCASVNGPGSTSGLLVGVWPAHSEAPRPLGYYPDQQTWVQVRNNVWVGWAGTTPPGPEDVDNGNPASVTSLPVTFADGRDWQVPEIRQPQQPVLFDPQAHSTSLPRLVKRDLTGQIVRPVTARHQELWTASGNWFERWLHLLQHGGTFDSDAALTYCLQVLQLRYRLTDYLNDAVGLLTSQIYQQVIGVSVGWTAVEAWLAEQVPDDDTREKKTPEPVPVTPSLTPTGDCGSKASTPTTDRPAANSGPPPAAPETGKAI